MDVIRGRASTPTADRDVTADALLRAAEGDTTVRVWAPHRQVAFGPRDAHATGYERAKRVTTKRGFRPTERRVGGRAVAYTGGGTLAFAVALPVAGESDREGIDRRYEIAGDAVRDALDRQGATVVEGEPDASFCPGVRSLRVPGGGKLSGLAQRVTRDAALVAGCLVVETEDAEAIAAVLAPVYRALDVPFDPKSVGSVAAAGGSAEPHPVARSLETAFVEGVWGDGTRRSKRVGPEPW